MSNPRKKTSFRRPTRRVNPNPLGAASSIAMKQHESMVIEPTLFGDFSGAHGDYSRGLFYGGRRKFLQEADEKLRPPSQFMTMKQKKNQVLQKRAGVVFAGITKLEFKKPLLTVEADGEPNASDNNHQVRRAAPVKKPQSTVTVEKFPSIDPVEWEEVKQAGCTFYVHTPTGEVSPEKPWIAIRNLGGGTGYISPDKSEASLRSFGGGSFCSGEWEYGSFDEGLEDEDQTLNENQEEANQWGCGSLAYDGKEMQDLLTQLDGVPWSGEKTPR